jgi:hypothetical protein
MPLTVRQLKEKCGFKDADVLGLKDGVRYILRIKGHASDSALEHTRKTLAEVGLNVAVCDDSVEFLEITE